MATEEVEAEYESDPEDALLSLPRRRREASDEEDWEESEVGWKSPRKNLRAGIGYDGDPNWQGAGTEYEDEESYVEEEEEEEELEEEVAVMEERASDRGGYAEKTMGLPTSDVDGQIWGGEPVVYQGKNLVEEVAEENKKNEKEPYAVPTAGAFYMHDDRFQEENKKNEKEPYAVSRAGSIGRVPH